MPQSWEIDILYLLVRKTKFYLTLHLGLFKKITASVAVEKNIQQ